VKALFSAYERSARPAPELQIGANETSFAANNPQEKEGHCHNTSMSQSGAGSRGIEEKALLCINSCHLVPDAKRRHIMKFGTCPIPSCHRFLSPSYRNRIDTFYTG